jgi:hypothetical protein
MRRSRKRTRDGKDLGSQILAFHRDEKLIWSPFLVSRLPRGPAMVAHMRMHGHEILSAGLHEAPEQYLAAQWHWP